MKISMRQAPKNENTSTKHNNREFDLDKAKHINQEKTKDNIIITYDNQPFETLDSVELKFYNERYGKWLNQKNNNYIKDGHKEKTKTMEEMMTIKNYKVKEMLIQVGDKDDNIGEEKFIQVINDLLETMKNKYPNFQMIDASIHLDETTPHCHLRGIFDIYNEKHDRYEIFQKKALNQMGFYQPDLEKEDTQFNNAKMSFDKDLREEIAKIVEKVAHIKIDLVPRENTEHLDILEFKKHAITKDLEAAREDLKQIDKELEERDIPKQLIDVEMKNPIKLGNIAFVNANNYRQMQANIKTTEILNYNNDLIKQKDEEQQKKQDDLNKREQVINDKENRLNKLMETDIVKSKLNELNELKQIKNDVNNAKEEYMNLSEQIINLSNEKKQLQAENQELKELNRGINPDIIQAQMQSLQLENERLRQRTNKLTTVIKEIRNRFELPKFITNLIDKALNTEVQSMDQTR